MKILVTGFEPFHKEIINPSSMILTKLPSTIKKHEIICSTLPVDLSCLNMIKDHINKIKPDVVLSLGQAAGRSAISVERIGINLDDFSIEDNKGNKIEDTKIMIDGPDAYFSNLPVKKMVEFIRNKGIPAYVSNSAGTYICNHILYGVRHILKQKGKQQKSGFIHVPMLPEQAIHHSNMPSMSLEMMVEGVIAAIEAIISEEESV